MKDYEALQALKDGGFYLDGCGHEEVKDSSLRLPSERAFCHSCGTTTLFPVTFVKMCYTRKVEVLYRCHKCGRWEKRTYVPPRKEYKLPTTEQRKRREMMSAGMDSEDIEEICKIYRAEYRAEDKKEERRRKGAYQRVFHSTAEQRMRTVLSFQGKSEDEINEICEVMKDDFAKEDLARSIERKNWEAERHESYEATKRNEEAASFKARLDAGEIRYIPKQRAFVEVSTGKIVRKL